MARAPAPAGTAAGHEVGAGKRDQLVATAQAARIVVNALPGAVSLEVLAGLREALTGKILIDVANAA